MLEQSIIAYCSPTLAAISTGNLFNCSSEGLVEEVAECNGCLNCKGVLTRVLRDKDGRALVYVFRPRKLWEDLKAPGVMEFLEGLGYRRGSICSLLAQLGERVQQSDSIPHEIGIFLGYPLEDVVGFIENKGKNFKCAGYWKVYSDEQSAQQTFRKFRYCTQLYGQRFLQGSTVQQLTVPA